MGNQESKNLKRQIQNLKIALDTSRAEIARRESERHALLAHAAQMRRDLVAAQSAHEVARSDLAAQIATLHTALDAAKAAIPPPPGRKIGGWNIVKSGGYYRAFRRVDGKIRGIHLGKTLRGAATKIRAKAPNAA